MFGEWFFALVVAGAVVLIFAAGNLCGFVMGWREAHRRAGPAPVLTMKRRRPD